MNLSQIYFGVCAGLLITAVAALLAQQGIIGWALALVGATVAVCNGVAWCYQRINNPSVRVQMPVYLIESK
ncbi:hypothetical protein QSV34_07525 [Porticoccus sp. W117]|uniref:hypothetical protein n=1 Tax=Porticoccus sp. W117 TaxID=3054777 RepID=UPI002597A541|nr:hypothetical protein [Porticoccus sp. W117]MDM3871203.1 hypothetical protein [Porticoccus sp. W117]